ncbi:hypothetical protein J3454_08630 [Erythrobacter sp. NFXS35]|uniref:fimbria/pilus outer membrane usher protein n=1 Tax=Erythrobacter sp. NFXS35 TaxID=2818436 RepID=UPI0032DFA467
MRNCSLPLLLFLSASFACGLVEPALSQEPLVNPIPLTVPVYDGDAPLGTVSAEVATDGNFRVPTESLLPILQRIYDADQFARLSEQLTGVQHVSRADAERLGVPLRFDQSRVALVLSIPADARGRTTLQFNSLGEEPAPTASRREPEDFSGYLNVSLGVIDDPRLLVGRTRGELFLDGAVRMGDFVIENTSILRAGGGDDRFHSRLATRITRDFPDQLMRVSVGDVIPPTVGFIGSVDLLGVSAFRNVEVFQPFRSTRPTGRQSFVLNETANVDIYVNGSLLRQERLPPGNYDLANFQLIEGANDVRIEIVNDRGEKQSLDFTNFFDSQLLAEGISQWEFAAGFRSQRFAFTIDYEFDTPVASGFYRRGVSDVLTLGGNFKLENDQIIMGGQAIAATGLGNFSLDAAASLTGSTPGGAVALTVRPQLPAGWRARGRTLDGFLEYTSESFGDNVFTRRGGGLRTGVRFTEILIPDRLNFTGNVGFNSTFSGRGGFETTASFAYRFENNLVARLTADYREAAAFDEAFAVRISIAKQFGRQTRAVANYDTRRNRYNANIDYRSQYGGIGTVTANLATSGADTQQRVIDGFASYTGNRFEATGGYTHIISEGRADEIGSLRANIATSIAFAGGEVAIGRPVRDGFAIVGGHETLDGRQIVVAPGNDFQGDIARSGSLGPALVPTLNAYSLNRLPIDVIDLPAGYDIGTGIVEFFPPLRSGYAIEIGSDRRASLIGVLLDQFGNRLGFSVGTASSRGDVEFGEQKVFTNRQGRFALTGLIPGESYRMVFTETGQSVIVTVPLEAEGFVDLGAIMVEDQQ